LFIADIRNGPIYKKIGGITRRQGWNSKSARSTCFSFSIYRLLVFIMSFPLNFMGQEFKPASFVFKKNFIKGLLQKTTLF